jgi:hypothetical protein
LLGGRDFESRDYKEAIAESSFEKLTEGVMDFMNEFSFTNFILSIKSAGFISNRLINSQMTLDFAYTLYLILNKNNQIDKTQIKRIISKWYVFSTLTSRYISSPESVMDMDIRRIAEKGFLDYFKEIEEANLSDTFWEIGLVQDLETSAINSPFFNVFLAAQAHGSDNSLLMNGTKVRDLITTMGDIHHIFPKGYLQKNGITDKSKYNQIANYIYLDSQTNISIGDKSPNEYFATVFEQCIPVKDVAPHLRMYDQFQMRFDPDSTGWNEGKLNSRSEMNAWLEYADGSHFDVFSLLMVPDVLPPAVFNRVGPNGWVPTLEMSVSIRALPQTSRLQIRARTRYLTRSILEEDVEVWDEQGNILAICRQIAKLRVA